MKVIIPENRLEQIIFKYLDVKFKDLEQSKGGSHDIIFKIVDNKNFIIRCIRVGDSAGQLNTCSAKV